MCPHGKNILLCGEKAGQLRQNLFSYSCVEARFALRHPFLLQVFQGLSAIVPADTVQLDFKVIVVKKFSEIAACPSGVFFLRILKHDMEIKIPRSGLCER